MPGRRDQPDLHGPSGLALAEVCWGAALALLADPLTQSVSGEPVTRRVVDVTRVLGVRQLMQGLLTLRRPTRRTLVLGAAVDALHAATMIAAAAGRVGPRRLTSASAAVAVTFAGAGVGQSRRSG